MEQISWLLQIMKNYIFNNNLNIDKSTFFTVIIGQITIYGILLTFYQFVAAYQGNKKAAIRYLGYNIIEFYVNKNAGVYGKIRTIFKIIFVLMFVLEILYKPIITVYGDMFPAEKICLINFLWFLLVISYFVMFFILFLRCTKTVLTIKQCSDIKTNESLISDINKMFLKKTMKERISKRAIDLLRRDFAYLHNAIQEDDNTELQDKYNNLVYLIFTGYIERKQNKISKIEKSGKILRNQVSWIYNSNCEVHLLQEIIDEIYFRLDEQNVRSILSFYINSCFVIFR